MPTPTASINARRLKLILRIIVFSLIEPEAALLSLAPSSLASLSCAEQSCILSALRQSRPSSISQLPSRSKG
ncbi:hypothetical protein CHELA40_14238 [Chelatococcus asaccharovorans]|nr:hypothetical protein CHELA17_61383 [Chelatococcus asaccharovorans]CAH1676132.1 hypothetical protein CHELA40_14238 [Chelatococcus asaccharovorans]